MPGRMRSSAISWRRWCLVFDGHGGSEVATYLQSNFMKIFTTTEEFKKLNYEGALDATFMKIDEKVSLEDYA